ARALASAWLSAASAASDPCILHGPPGPPRWRLCREHPPPTIMAPCVLREAPSRYARSTNFSYSLTADSLGIRVLTFPGRPTERFRRLDVSALANGRGFRVADDVDEGCAAGLVTLGGASRNDGTIPKAGVRTLRDSFLFCSALDPQPLKVTEVGGPVEHE